MFKLPLSGELWTVKVPKYKNNRNKSTSDTPLFWVISDFFSLSNILDARGIEKATTYLKERSKLTK